MIFAKMMNRNFNVDWKKTCWDANTCRVDESVEAFQLCYLKKNDKFVDDTWIA